MDFIHIYQYRARSTLSVYISNISNISYFIVISAISVLFVLCLGVYLFFFVLLAPFVCFYIFNLVKVTEWPPIGKIAAHSAYDMFHGISA